MKVGCDGAAARPHGRSAHLDRPRANVKHLAALGDPVALHGVADGGVDLDQVVHGDEPRPRREPREVDLLGGHELAAGVRGRVGDGAQVAVAAVVDAAEGADESLAVGHAAEPVPVQVRDIVRYEAEEEGDDLLVALSPRPRQGAEVLDGGYLEGDPVRLLSRAMVRSARVWGGRVKRCGERGEAGARGALRAARTEVIRKGAPALRGPAPWSAVRSSSRWDRGPRCEAASLCAHLDRVVVLPDEPIQLRVRVLIQHLMKRPMGDHVVRREAAGARRRCHGQHRCCGCGREDDGHAGESAPENSRALRGDALRRRHRL